MSYFFFSHKCQACYQHGYNHLRIQVTLACIGLKRSPSCTASQWKGWHSEKSPRISSWFSTMGPCPIVWPLWCCTLIFFMPWTFSQGIIAEMPLFPWWERYQHDFPFIVPHTLGKQKPIALWILNAWNPSAWYDFHLVQPLGKFKWTYGHDLGQ